MRPWLRRTCNGSNGETNRIHRTPRRRRDVRDVMQRSIGRCATSERKSNFVFANWKKLAVESGKKSGQPDVADRPALFNCLAHLHLHKSLIYQGNPCNSVDVEDCNIPEITSH